MTAFRFHALTTATVADALEAGDRGGKAAPHMCVRHGDLVAIVSPAPRLPAFLTSRRALAHDLVAFQRILEVLMVFGPIVPAAYRASFRDQSSIVAFLAANHLRLREALGEFGDKRQFQIAIGWNPTAMLRLLGGGSDFQTALSEAGSGVAQGQAIQRLMEAQRATMAQMFETVLRSAALDSIVMPVADADSILNITVLIERDGEQRLDEAVRAIDATASDALVIKMAGPLPACGFASLDVDLPAPAAIASACRRLGVQRMAALDELKAAYYARMRAAHPDVAATNAVPDWDAKPDYDLLVRVRTAELALAPTGCGTAAAVPVLKLLRADLVGLAA